MKPYYIDFLKIKKCNSFVLLHSDIFRAMDNHCYELMKIMVSFKGGSSRARVHYNLKIVRFDD